MSKTLQAAVAAATKKIGAELVGAMCNTFGSRTFDASDVPADRQPGLIAVLQKLAGGERVNVAMAKTAIAGPKPPARKRTATAAEKWNDIEDGVGYKVGAVKAVPEGATLESIHADAYARWNAKRKA